MKDDSILLGHGGGGLLSHELVTGKFLPFFRNTVLERLEDGAVFEIDGLKLCFSTDSFVVNPVFFPGGDIGSLAVNGTVNDLSMCGGTPLFLSAGFILEEGFPMIQLERIIESMAKASQDAGVQIVTGDTKVVPRGTGDGLYINTTGIGVVHYQKVVSTASIAAGDMVILNGSIGDHGAAILSQREELGLDTPIISDSVSLNGLVRDVLEASLNVHAMRDATRGGLGGILAEIADQSGCQIVLEEGSIPVKDAVKGVCEILGFDPMFLANEGKMVLFCSREDSQRVLEAMKAHPYGREAAIIGRVEKKGTGRLVLNTVVGGSRVIDLPAGELVPRIC